MWLALGLRTRRGLLKADGLMPKPKAPRKTELLDMGSRTLAEHEEAQRRAYHQRIRQELLADAAPRLKAKGWRVTEKEER
jgi:hypothetical protein